MRRRPVLVSVRSLVEAGNEDATPDLSYIHQLAYEPDPAAVERQKKAVAARSPGHNATTAAGSKTPKLPAGQADPMSDPSHLVAALGIQSPKRAILEPHETGSANLSDLHAPELSSSFDRSRAHAEGFSHSSATVERSRYMGSSGYNPVFHFSLSNGHESIVKPVNSMIAAHEPAHAGARSHFVYDTLSAMGAHHMGAPTSVHQIHPEERMSEKGVERIPEGAPPEHAKNNARSHAGQPAYVSSFVPGSTSLKLSDQNAIDSVDEHHRLIGAVTHLLSGNVDGHAGNILMVKGRKGHYPVLIDHDLTGDNHAARGYRKTRGKDAVRSEFLYNPDDPTNSKTTGMLAPRREWGTSYPPAVLAHLQELASGGHSVHHAELPPGDQRLIRKNAQDLLTKGLEQTIRERHLIPPSAEEKSGLK